MSYLLNGWYKGAVLVPSPNYNTRPVNSTIDCIILHGISLPPGKFGENDILALFTNTLNTKNPGYSSLKGLKVSAHFLISRTGILYQFVKTAKRAWHAGKSTWLGRSDCNNFSIGIELEGTDSIAYTEVQYEQLVALVTDLKNIYSSITNNRIIGHKDVAPGRKTDPGEAFRWDYFFNKLEMFENRL